VEGLTDAQMAELKEDLLALVEELSSVLEASKDGAKPVELDQPIGRLSRMDAIQQQKMVSANRQSMEVRLQRVEAALKHMEEGIYGECRRCEEEIAYPRLKARPEAPFCLDCQGAIEKRG
jgi:DnaK suppressor protein